MQPKNDKHIKKITRSKTVIEILRKHYGLSNSEFAKMLDVCGSTVSAWGTRDSLDVDLIYRKCPGVRYDFLITGEGDMFDKDVLTQLEGGMVIPPDIACQVEKFLGLNKIMQIMVADALDRLSRLDQPEQYMVVGEMLQNISKREKA